MSKLNSMNTKNDKENKKKNNKNDKNLTDDYKLDEKLTGSDNNLVKGETEHEVEENNDNEETRDDEIEKIKDQLLRTLAENENIRKRTAKDIEQIKKFGHISFVRDLLSSVDNLSRAVKASPINKDKLDEPIKNLIVGVEIVLKEINSFLEKNHIVKIEPLGKKFDYNLHQAMYEAPSEKFETGIVTEVIQNGYLLHDRLVRPAMVGISKNNEKKED